MEKDRPTIQNGRWVERILKQEKFELNQILTDQKYMELIKLLINFCQKFQFDVLNQNHYLFDFDEKLFS